MSHSHTELVAVAFQMAELWNALLDVLKLAKGGIAFRVALGQHLLDRSGGGGGNLKLTLKLLNTSA